MSDSNQDWTCGMGLALGSEMPARMADLLTSWRAISSCTCARSTAATRLANEELIAYQRLTGQMREVSGSLEALAGAMADYRDLPMAPHDEAALNTPEVHDAFHELIAQERGFAEYLNASVDAFTAAVETQTQSSE